jgi:hypothetical protein
MVCNGLHMAGPIGTCSCSNASSADGSLTLALMSPRQRKGSLHCQLPGLAIADTIQSRQGVRANMQALHVRRTRASSSHSSSRCQTAPQSCPRRLTSAVWLM